MWKPETVPYYVGGTAVEWAPAGSDYQWIRDNLDLDGDNGIAEYELCLYRGFPKILCLGPIAREFIKKDSDSDWIVTAEEVGDHDNMFTMIFKIDFH